MDTLTAFRALASAVALLGLTGAAPAPQEPPHPQTSPPAKAPHIEVCLVLDTPGSMGGLIEGAKRKIWSIANQMITTQPQPQLKIALVAFRDRGDEYVTRLVDLTVDLHAVYANLQALTAGGGGQGRTCGGAVVLGGRVSGLGCGRTSDLDRGVGGAGGRTSDRGGGEGRTCGGGVVLGGRASGLGCGRTSDLDRGVGVVTGVLVSVLGRGGGRTSVRGRGGD